MIAGKKPGTNRQENKKNIDNMTGDRLLEAFSHLIIDVKKSQSKNEHRVIFTHPYVISNPSDLFSSIKRVFILFSSDALQFQLLKIIN